MLADGKKHARRYSTQHAIVVVSIMDQFKSLKRSFSALKYELNHSRGYEMLCAICYHFYNLKNVKSTHGVAGFTVTGFSSNTLPWVFSRFLNCANGIKLRNASQMFY